MARFVTIWIMLLGLAGYAHAQNPYYDHGSFPSPGTIGSSAAMRAELDLIEAGFAKLPTLSGNANKPVVVNSAGTALTTSTGQLIIPQSTFPLTPAVDQVVLLTTASTPGACVAGGGTARTLCRWDGIEWVAVISGGVSGWPTVSTDKEITWANSLASAARFGNGTNYWAIYHDATNGLQLNCVIATVENDCDYYRILNNGKFFGIKNSAGTTVLQWSHTGTQTKGFRDERYFPVVTCQGGVAQAIHNLPTTNFPAATCDPANTNSIRGYLAFDDTTDEAFFDEWVWPAGATSVDGWFLWKGVNTTNAAGWCMQLVRIPDGATSDPAFPAQATGNCVSDTAKGTTLQENVATIPNVTCTSCVAGDRIAVRISRDANGGAVTDSFVGDGLLLMFGRIFKN